MLFGNVYITISSVCILDTIIPVCIQLTLDKYYLPLSDRIFRRMRFLVLLYKIRL
uniref:Uncharacterized protein n=1 Tax=Octopus bimaculoides TaxID=37653 RepID=A0A0L8GW64_OCTBM